MKEAENEKCKDFGIPTLAVCHPDPDHGHPGGHGLAAREYVGFFGLCPDRGNAAGIYRQPDPRMEDLVRRRDAVYLPGGRSHEHVPSNRTQCPKGHQYLQRQNRFPGLLYLHAHYRICAGPGKESPDQILCRIYPHHLGRRGMCPGSGWGCRATDRNRLGQRSMQLRHPHHGRGGTAPGYSP